MIEKIQIRNAGPHKKLDITFSPLVNSIIGRNAAGKSWILRAIRWVVRNKPAGDSIINWNADKAAVRLTIDKNKITRTRGKGINTYKLNKGKPYKAFRNEVPKDIEKIINLSDINFQGQHEAPFWFCETPPEVSRQLNAIVNLEVIDKTLSNIGSTIRESQTTIKIVNDRLEKATVQLTSLTYVEQMDEDLKRVENLQKQHQAKTAALTTMDDVLILVQIHRSKRDIASELVSHSRLALSIGAKYRKITVQVENLSKLVSLGVNLQKVIKAKPPSINHLERLKKKKNRTFNHSVLLGQLLKNIEMYKEEKCLMDGDLKKCKRELKKIAEGRCPLCGTTMKK